MSAEEITALYARQNEAARADPIKRGAYLVETLNCTLCHSPVDENKRELPGMRLAGGLLVRLAPFGDYVIGNLTSDKETGLGNWSDDEIKRVITRSRRTSVRHHRRSPTSPILRRARLRNAAGTSS